MRTTVDIPDDLMASTLKLSRMKTKREAIIGGLKLLQKSGATERLLSLEGKFPGLKKMINLDKLRERDHYKKFL